jgi:quercetin dioxygenase-like cupin family protein
MITLLLVLAALAVAPPPQAIQVNAGSIAWKEGPPTLPKGTQSAVLEGDPKGSGIFTMRLHVPAGAKVPPHWHPRPERVTVLSGHVQVGFGDHWNEAALRSFHAGDFYVNPANSHHFVRFTEESVIQITGEGPWELHTLE